MIVCLGISEAKKVNDDAASTVSTSIFSTYFTKLVIKTGYRPNLRMYTDLKTGS